MGIYAYTATVSTKIKLKRNFKLCYFAFLPTIYICIYSFKHSSYNYIYKNCQIQILFWEVFLLFSYLNLRSPRVLQSEWQHRIIIIIICFCWVLPLLLVYSLNKMIITCFMKVSKKFIFCLSIRN